MDVFVTFLVSLAVITVAAVLFCGWLLWVVMQSLMRAFFGIGRKTIPTRHAGQGHQTLRICPRYTCQAENPAEARYCRRCGRALSDGQQVHVRRHRAAVW